MKSFLLLLFLTLALTQGLDDSSSKRGQQSYQKNIGQIIHGSSTLQSQGRSYHYLRIQSKQKKYLFFRVSPLNNDQQSNIGIYIYEKDGTEPIATCVKNSYDTCYVKAQKIKQNSVILVIIQCTSSCKYVLYSYWQDLQHLKPNQELKFKFQQTNPSQLFHLNLEKEDYQQIRIIMKPETYREQMDNVKLFVNYGFDEEPSPQTHDLESIHVWNEAQAIFLTKSELKNYKGLMLLIVGNAKTVYTLTCELIVKDHHDLQINETIYEYVEPVKQSYYHVTLPNDDSFDEFSLKFSIFTGELSVGYYYDKEFTKQLMLPPAQYMSDMQFVFKKSQIQGDKKQIYIRVGGSDVLTTYMLVFQGRHSQKAHEIQEFVYQFLRVKEKAAVYYFDTIYDESNEYQNFEEAEYSVKILNVKGNPSFEFRSCRPLSQISDCTDLENDKYLNYTNKFDEIQSISEIGLSRIYRLKLKKQNFTSINGVEKRIMIMAVFTNVQQKKSYVAIEYSNDNRIRILRDNRVVEEKINGYQSRYYKYVNSDPTVQKISVDLNTISGLVQVVGQRKDFRNTHQIPLKINNDKLDIITVRDKVTQPIYIKITGLVNSIYTIGIKTEHEDHPFSASMTLAEDIQYNFKLGPKETILLQIHPILDKIIFQYESEGGPLQVCLLDENSKCVDESLKDLGKNKGKIEFQEEKMHNKFVRVYNYVSDNNVEMKAIYHSGDYSHCDERRVNQIYNERVKSGQCFKFTLPTGGDVSVSAKRTDLGSNVQIYSVCSQIVELTQKKYMSYIPGKTIKQKCRTTPNDITITMIVADDDLSSETDIKLQYSLEYLDDLITLKDGIGYNAKGFSKQGISRTFQYKMINKKNTEVILLNRKGSQSFHVNIVANDQKYIQKTDPFKIYSNQSNYQGNPTVQITMEHLEKAKCGDNCFLLIDIFSSEKAGQQIQYTIEVTQNSIHLNQNELRKSFLSENSVDYYEFESRLKGQSIVVSLSTNNRDCSKIYISNKQYPSNSNFLKTQTGNELVYENSEKQTYYLAVQAINDCPYSITISQQKVKITRIREGQLSDVKLKEGERAYFLARHISKQSFKLLSLQKFGNIIIYANKTNLSSQVLASIRNNVLKPQEFQYKSSYKNSLYIDKDDKNFCSDCYFLIMAEAKKQTQTSLFFGDSFSVIPIGDKILFDELHAKGDSSFAKFYNVKPGTLLVKVHAGSINVALKYKNKTIESHFDRDRKVQRYDYNITRLPEDFTPININITSTSENTLYSIALQVKNSSQTKVQTYKVVPGKTTYLFIDVNQKSCLEGYIKDLNDEILISTVVEKIQTLKNLQISGALDGNERVEIQNETVGNIQLFKFNVANKYINSAIPYQICLKTQKESISFDAFQIDDFNLVPPDTQTIIRKEQKFVLHPHGEFLLDIFTCRGQASFKYASSQDKLQSSQEKYSQLKGMPGQSHAVRIEKFTTIFLDIKSNLSTVLWMPVNEEQERGLGYFNYDKGSLTYKSNLNFIQFNIQGIKRIKQTKTQVSLIRYILIISNSKEDLQQAVMCDNFYFDNIIKIYIGNYGEKQLNKTVLSEMKKSMITQRFNKGDTLFYNVVADLTLLVPLQEKNVTEHYKFVYYQQQVPVEVFSQISLQNMNLALKISLVVAIVIGLVIIGYVFVRWIVPALGRLKNRFLVQQAEDNNKDQSIPVPPSSDRNQIQSNNVGAQDKMT